MMGTKLTLPQLLLESVMYSNFHLQTVWSGRYLELGGRLLLGRVVNVQHEWTKISVPELPCAI